MISTLRKHRRKQSRVDQKKKKAVESECSEAESKKSRK